MTGKKNRDLITQKNNAEKLCAKITQENREKLCSRTSQKQCRKTASTQGSAPTQTALATETSRNAGALRSYNKVGTN
jgi:hypothetical protein